jgi:DNA-3-methyladenine glycosylase II
MVPNVPGRYDRQAGDAPLGTVQADARHGDRRVRARWQDDRMTRHRDASLELAERSPVFAGLVGDHGPMRIPARTPVPARFESIARAITFQQLAGRAAQTIWGRVRALTPEGFAPKTVLALDPTELRDAGLSGAKTAAVLDLALQVDTGQVRLDRLGRRSDPDVVAELTQVRGVGPWTAQMFLIFDLHRLDVWPTGDLGVRAGYQRAFGLPELPTPRALEDLGADLVPVRSVAAWYCWRVLDTKTPEQTADAGGEAS